MQQIIFYLTNTLNPLISAVVLDGSGNCIKTYFDIPITELAPLCQDKTVIIITPPQDVSLITVRLPVLNRNKLRQAAPYAIEEQLLGEISELHFALGPQNAEGDVLIAVVKKNLLEGWLQFFKDHHISPKFLFPASLIQPASGPKWQVIINAEFALIYCAGAALYCDKDNLTQILQYKIDSAETPPTELIIRNYSDNTVSVNYPGVTIQQTSLPPGQFITDLASWIKLPALNLLQGRYQPRYQMSFNKKIIPLAYCLILTWLMLILGGNFVSYLILHKQNATLEKQINQIYYLHFPHAKTVSAPKQRMETKLKNLLGISQQNTFLQLLADLSKSHNQTKGVRLQHIEFKNNQLIVDLSSPSIDQFEQLIQSLKQRNLTVKQQNITSSTLETKGSLVISAGGKK